MHGVSEGRPPELNLDTEKKLLGGVLKAIQSGLVQSAHDVSEGLAPRWRASAATWGERAMVNRSA